MHVASKMKCCLCGTFYSAELSVGDVIFAPNDTISVEKRSNVMWAVIRGAHKIPRKKEQSTKGSTNGPSHWCIYTAVAAAPE